MTEGLAIEIARQMMQEQGVNENYTFRLRHFQLAALATLKIRAHNELYILLNPDNQIRVSSKAGTFNLTDARINEMQYIHRGVITLINQSKGIPTHVKMLQVIPKLNS